MDGEHWEFETGLAILQTAVGEELGGVCVAIDDVFKKGESGFNASAAGKIY